MAQITTPATEALDAAGAKYEFLEAPGAISGEDYSRMVGADRAARLFKTLVMKGDTTGSIYVFVVPALAKLSQRQTARALGEHALEMIKLVGIPAPEKVFKSYPHELSGGMRQRIMIAMALACQPSLLICDEPTTALDVTIQAQILQLIDRMRDKLGTAVMLITHDMGVVSEMADWVLVMYAGHKVEYTLAPELFTNPLHPYSRGLIDSIPSLDNAVDTLYAIPGNVPMLSEMPKGCPFHPRCPFAKDICRQQAPEMLPVEGDENHLVACWKYRKGWGE